MSWCSKHECPSEVCERAHDPSLIPDDDGGDDSGEWEAVDTNTRPIRSGVGCSMVIFSLAVATCLVVWALQGFPKFWL